MTEISTELAIALVAWLALLVLIVEFWELAWRLEKPFANTRPRAVHHGKSRHIGRLLLYSLRLFAAVVLSSVIPASAIAFALANPSMFFLNDAPIFVSQTNPTASSFTAAFLFVADLWANGILGDAPEYYGFYFTMVEPAYTPLLLKPVLVCTNLLFGAIGLYAFIRFSTLLVDLLFIWLPIWPSPEKGKWRRINLSKTSRGYLNHLQST